MSATRLVTTGIVLALWTAATLVAAAPHLRKTHTGWRQTACFECHDKAAMGKTHKALPPTPADCGPCHGYNGAPHESHAVAINPCGNCHARVAHAAAFRAPADCIKCHVHPQSPQGR